MLEWRSSGMFVVGTVDLAGYRGGGGCRSCPYVGAHVCCVCHVPCTESHLDRCIFFFSIFGFSVRGVCPSGTHSSVAQPSLGARSVEKRGSGTTHPKCEYQWRTGLYRRPRGR